jgi:uncharacterized protein YbaP (TraB family)
VTRRLAALLATLLATAVLVAAAAPAGAAGRSVVWSVQGERNTVYLFGSIHVLRPGDAGLPGAAVTAYDDAEQLVMEIDMDDPAVADPLAMAAQMQRYARLPAGQSLESVLGDDYATVAARIEEAGLDLAMFDGFAPWFVGMLVVQLEVAKRGFDPAHGIEQQITDRAARDGKPIRGLETPADQFAVLAGLSLPEQKRFLLMTLEETDQTDARLEQLLTAWRTGDTATLARVLAEEFQEFPELYRPLTEDRNRAWVTQLTPLLDDRDDYLVVVGALHLVGRNSVVDLLRQRGYRVTQH